MNEMVERVARAIARSHYGRRSHVGHCTREERLDFLVGKYWDQFVGAAEDVIAAMREPTESMIEAAWAEATGENAAGVWRDMIDATMANAPYAPGD